MSESQPKELTPQQQSWYEVWKTCTEQVLSQVAGQPMAFELSSEAMATAETDLWYTVTASGAAQGEMTLRLAADSAARLAQKFLGETEPASEPTAEHKEALEELLRQIAGQAATALGSSLGGKVQLQVAVSAAPTWAAGSANCLRTRDEGGTPVAIEIQISAALSATLQPETEVQPAAAAPAATPVPPPELPPEAASYQRLLDVGLEVKLRFGVRRMLLRDVLALSAGVVVELESGVDSPVDLLLDNRIVAHGEVVVVDGKYGLRVTQVVDSRTAV